MESGKSAKSAASLNLSLFVSHPAVIFLIQTVIWWIFEEESKISDDEYFAFEYNLRSDWLELYFWVINF